MVMQLYGRDDELARIQKILNGRQSCLLHGPAGVGKSRVLQEGTRTRHDVVLLTNCGSPQKLFSQLLLRLVELKDAEIVRRLGGNNQDLLKHKSVVTLKGVALEALKRTRYSVILDQVSFASQALAAAIKDVASETGVPMVVATRSQHMEDVGYVLKMFPDRKDRFELRNFDPQKAESFALAALAETGLAAANIPEFVKQVLELSDGNPGAILQMIDMARDSKYRSGDHIKTVPLYVDFRLARNAAS